MIRPVRADGRIDTGGVFTPIYRPRVVDRIAAAAEQRVVLIVAPAGYGKSTALRQYLDGVSAPVVRYDLHTDNAGLLGFLRGLTEALVEVAPDARKTLVTAYDSARDSTAAGSELAMWLHAHIKTYNGTIVIDDLHIAEGERQVSAFLASIIERTKGRVRWIIASRSFLDLPVGSWLAYQEMDLAIDETDLAFTNEEARGTARASRVGVRDEELESLVDLTGGWPTALAFALRTSTRSHDLRNVQAVTREMVYKYLAEQVYGSLDASDRDLLATCALMPEIDIDVLEAAGYDDALATIEALRHRVAFIASHPDRARVYKMHDLFRDFVLHRLELEGAEALAMRRTQVANALEARGDIASAIRLLVLADERPSIERLLDASGFDLFDAGHGDAIIPALDALKIDGAASGGTVLALRAHLEAAQGRAEEAEGLFRRAIRKTVDRERRANLELRLARVSINRGTDPSELLLVLESDEDISSDSRGEASAMLAVFFTRTGRADLASGSIERALAAATTSENARVRARIFQRIGLAASERGDAENALSWLQTATDLALRESLLSLATMCYSALATMMVVHYDDHAKNLWYAQQGHVVAVKSGYKADMHMSALHLLGAEARRGNLDRVAAIERLLGELGVNDPSRLKYAAGARALRRSWEGSFGDAFRLVSDLWWSVPERYNQISAGSECAVYAAADGRTSDAATIVAKVIAVVDATADDRSVTASCRSAGLLLCALAEALSGRHVSAAKIARRVHMVDEPPVETLRLATLRCIRSLKTGVLDQQELGEDIDHLRSFGRGGYALLMQAAMTKAFAEKAAGNASTALTRAEIAVLRSLAMGSTPKDIAAETGRSIYTVQAHIQNAIEKLGCHGRQEAIVAAQRLGVV